MAAEADLALFNTAADSVRLLAARIRFAAAERNYRTAWETDEASYGPDHPNVATALNNLGALLWKANRLDEAEPLIRRVVEIFLLFTQRTGRPHPHLNDALQNYTTLLQAMGRSEADTRQELNRLLAKYGMAPE